MVVILLMWDSGEISHDSCPLSTRRKLNAHAGINPFKGFISILLPSIAEQMPAEKGNSITVEDSIVSGTICLSRVTTLDQVLACSNDF